jgi:hypothetical protein
MDDFNIDILKTSRDEWGSQLIHLLTPPIINGFHSILKEAIGLCRANNEEAKYLMTFQNLIARIPAWNQTIIENECKRIKSVSKCNYLEDIITCVHITQLKAMTAIRVGQKQKKINIKIPKLEEFIHKTYINCAKKMYKQSFLFQVNINAIQMQKNNVGIENIVHECILNTVRENMPVEDILKAYLDETVEDDVKEEIKEEIIETPLPPVEIAIPNAPISKPANLSFNDVDHTQDINGNISTVNAPKTIERLEEISEMRHNARKAEEEQDDSDESEPIGALGDFSFSNEPVQLEFDDIPPTNANKAENLPDKLPELELQFEDI